VQKKRKGVSRNSRARREIKRGTLSLYDNEKRDGGRRKENSRYGFRQNSAGGGEKNSERKSLERERERT